MPAALSRLACRIVDFDQLHSGLNAEFFFLQLREGLLQIGLRSGGLADPFFRHAEQRLNLPEDWAAA